ncbi:nucleoprotein/polynucleotide-associated enzyme [Vibrio sp. JCM 19236]|nr:nucleoprotein/polynucleotide-associated enzyme [Vibrio sp. JCM 19236]
MARDGEGYAVIPTVVAEKIATRVPEAVVATAEPTEETVDEDDPYKDFVVPDDLMW